MADGIENSKCIPAERSKRRIPLHRARPEVCRRDRTSLLACAARRACRLRPKGDLVNGAQQHSWQLRQGSGLDKRRYCVCMSQSLPVSRSTLDMCSAYTVAALGSSCLVAARLDSMLTVSIARPAWEGQSRLAKAILECVILAVSAPCLTQASRPPPSPPRSGCPLPARLTSPPLARTAGTGPACTAQGWSANGSIIREDRR